jgi:transposase
MGTLRRLFGIDVAKAGLDVFMEPAGTAFTVANDEVGIKDLLRQRVSAYFVILEAGGLKTFVASPLAAAGIAMAIVNPRQV